MGRTGAVGQHVVTVEGGEPIGARGAGLDPVEHPERLELGCRQFHGGFAAITADLGSGDDRRDLRPRQGGDGDDREGDDGFDDRSAFVVALETVSHRLSLGIANAVQMG